MFGQFLSYKNTIATLLAVALTGCGDVAVEQPKDEAYGEQLDDDQGGLKKEPADEAGEPRRDNTSSHDTAATQVNVSVEVEVIVDRHGGDLALLGDAAYAPIERSWDEALDAAPEGMRLATRAEVIELLDAGVLAELGADDTIVWTGSERDDGAVYIVDTRTGQVVPAGKVLELEAVYVRGDQ